MGAQPFNIATVVSVYSKPHPIRKEKKNDYPLREISITDFNTPIYHPFRFSPV